MNRPTSIFASEESASPRAGQDATFDTAAPDLSAANWSAFTEASSAEGFCRAWLAIQCSLVQQTRAGLLLLQDPSGKSYVPAAIWPHDSHDVTHLAATAERALAHCSSMVTGLDVVDAGSVRAGSIYVACPIQDDTRLEGAVVLDLAARPESDVESVLQQLLWGTGWLVAMLRRQYLAREGQLLERASTALALVHAAQLHPTLSESAMAVVNELATVANADRVSLGILRKGDVRLRAMSRTAWFDRKSQLVELIENAMEEALDQDAGLAHPGSDFMRGKVTVAQRDLALHSGDAAVLTALLKSNGNVVGALTLERTQGEPFDRQTSAVCEAAGELVGPLIEARLERERWLRGRLVETSAQWWGKLVGPRRPGLKLGTLLALLVVVFLAFASGEFRVSARTFVEGQIQRAAVAPFDSYIAEAFVRAGETVRQGALLAKLDDRDLELERTRWEAEKSQAERKYQEALAKRDRAAAGILAAQREQAQAQLSLADEKLIRARIVAPFDAVVVAGDLSQMLGAPVEKGKVLFDLAPLDRYRVVLNVDERDIAYVVAGQRGELGLTGIAERTLPFTVKSVTSVATAQEGRNFFRVEAQLDDASERLRPGMEGVGKVSIGERRLVWIWTRNFTAWLRLAFWSWLP